MGKIWIPGGGDGADLDVITAASSDVRKGKVIVDKDGNPLTGIMAEIAAKTYTPGTSNQVIAANQFLAGAQTIKGDGNLNANNIVYGKSIFGVSGNVRKYASITKTLTSSTSKVNFTGGDCSIYAYHVSISNIGFTPLYASIVGEHADYTPIQGGGDGWGFAYAERSNRSSYGTQFLYWLNGGYYSLNSGLVRLPAGSINGGRNMTVKVFGYY